MAFVPCTPTFAAPATRRSAVSTRSPTMAADKPAAARLMGLAAAVAVAAASVGAPDVAMALSNPLSGAGEAISNVAADAKSNVKSATSSDTVADAKDGAKSAASAVGDKVKSDVDTVKDKAIAKDREIKDNFDIDADKLADQASKVNQEALKKGAMDAEAVGKGIKKTFSN